MKKFLHILKRLTVGLLKGFGVLVATLLVLLVTAVVVFFAMPEIEVKSDKLKSLVSRFAPEDLQLNWDDASVRFVKTGTLSKDIVLELNNACIQYKGEAIDACFERLFWGLGVSVSNFNPRISQFVPLIATGGVIKGDSELLASDEPEQPEQEGGFSIVDFARNELLPKWKWNGSIVELKKIDFKMDGHRLTGAVLLETQGSWNQSSLAQEADRLEVKISERNVSEQFLRLSVIKFNYPGLLKTSAQAHFVLPVTEVEGWLAALKGDIVFVDGKRVLLTSNNRIHNWQSADFQVNAIIKNISYIREAALKGKYRKDSLEGVVGAKMGALHSEIKTLDFVDCNFDIALNDKTAAVRCGPQTVVLGLQERPAFRNKNLFRLHPTVDFKISNFSYEKAIEADWAMKLALNHLQIVTLDVDAFGSVHQQGATDTEEAQLRYSADAEVDLKLPDFKRLIDLVRSTPFAIPAPLNQMQGSMQLAASGAITEAGGDLPFRFQTRLSSQYQKLDTTLGGGLALKQNAKGELQPELFVDLALENVRLSLPRIDVTSTPPQFLPDSRFKKGLSKDKPPTNEGAGGGLAYQVRVATSQPNAIRIATNLTGAPLPITLRYALKSLPPGQRAPEQAPDFRPASTNASEPKQPTTQSAGKVSIARTPVDLSNASKLLAKFQRDAVIDYFHLTLEPDGEQKIDGRLLVKTPDAEIRVLLLGTTDQPVVLLESDPPADESQIMAALLFNRPLDQVDEGQAESAAQAKTALNDTALTLVQVFLLANTPIDSLNYDAESGRVVASIGVGNGTSLELGGGAEGAGTEVGLKRRLARNVYLNTYVETEAQTRDRVVNAFVEWVRRF